MNSKSVASSSPPYQWLNVLACPEEVMEEVAHQPPKFLNWLIPTLLVCAVSSLCGSGPEPAAAQNQELFRFEIQRVAELVSTVIACLTGVFWSAFVFWGIARFIFKTKVAYCKALEVVGLCGTILSLSIFTTVLLGSLTGRATAHPALSLLLDETSGTSKLFVWLDAVHVFNLWIVAVLAVGLAKLTNAEWKECILWTTVYWIIMRALFAAP